MGPNCKLLVTDGLKSDENPASFQGATMTVRKPLAVLSNRDDGYDVQFEEFKSGAFVCRKCCYHLMRDDAQLYRASMAIKHLSCHKEDGHRIDPNAMHVLRGKL